MLALLSQTDLPLEQAVTDLEIILTELTSVGTHPYDIFYLLDSPLSQNRLDQLHANLPLIKSILKIIHSARSPKATAYLYTDDITESISHILSSNNYLAQLQSLEQNLPRLIEVSTSFYRRGRYNYAVDIFLAGLESADLNRFLSVYSSLNRDEKQELMTLLQSVNNFDRDQEPHKKYRVSDPILVSILQIIASADTFEQTMTNIRSLIQIIDNNSSNDFSLTIDKKRFLTLTLNHILTNSLTIPDGIHFFSTVAPYHRYDLYTYEQAINIYKHIEDPAAFESWIGLAFNKLDFNDFGRLLFHASRDPEQAENLLQAVLKLNNNGFKFYPLKMPTNLTPTEIANYLSDINTVNSLISSFPKRIRSQIIPSILDLDHPTDFMNALARHPGAFLPFFSRAESASSVDSLIQEIADSDSVIQGLQEARNRRLTDRLSRMGIDDSYHPHNLPPSLGYALLDLLHEYILIGNDYNLAPSNKRLLSAYLSQLFPGVSEETIKQLSENAITDSPFLLFLVNHRTDIKPLLTLFPSDHRAIADLVYSGIYSKAVGGDTKLDVNKVAELLAPTSLYLQNRLTDTSIAPWRLETEKMLFNYYLEHPSTDLDKLWLLVNEGFFNYDSIPVFINNDMLDSVLTPPIPDTELSQVVRKERFFYNMLESQGLKPAWTYYWQANVELTENTEFSKLTLLQSQALWATNYLINAREDGWEYFLSNLDGLDYIAITQKIIQDETYAGRAEIVWNFFREVLKPHMNNGLPIEIQTFWSTYSQIPSIRPALNEPNGLTRFTQQFANKSPNEIAALGIEENTSLSVIRTWEKFQSNINNEILDHVQDPVIRQFWLTYKKYPTLRIMLNQGGLELYRQSIYSLPPQQLQSLSSYPAAIFGTNLTSDQISNLLNLKSKLLQHAADPALLEEAYSLVYNFQLSSDDQGIRLGLFANWLYGSTKSERIQTPIILTSWRLFRELYPGTTFPEDTTQFLSLLNRIENSIQSKILEVENSSLNLPPGYRVSIGPEIEVKNNGLARTDRFSLDSLVKLKQLLNQRKSTGSSSTSYIDAQIDVLMGELNSQRYIAEQAYREQAKRLVDIGVSKGVDGTWEFANRPVSDYSILIWELSELEKLGFFTLHPQILQWIGERGIHLTVSGDQGIIKDENAILLQNSLLATGYANSPLAGQGGIQDAEEKSARTIEIGGSTPETIWSYLYTDYSIQTGEYIRSKPGELKDIFSENRVSGVEYRINSISSLQNLEKTLYAFNRLSIPLMTYQLNKPKFDETKLLQTMTDFLDDPTLLSTIMSDEYNDFLLPEITDSLDRKLILIWAYYKVKSIENFAKYQISGILPSPLTSPYSKGLIVMDGELGQVFPTTENDSSRLLPDAFASFHHPPRKNTLPWHMQNLVAQTTSAIEEIFNENPSSNPVLTPLNLDFKTQIENLHNITPTVSNTVTSKSLQLTTTTGVAAAILAESSGLPTTEELKDCLSYSLIPTAYAADGIGTGCKISFSPKYLLATLRDPQFRQIVNDVWTTVGGGGHSGDTVSLKKSAALALITYSAIRELESKTTACIEDDPSFWIAHGVGNIIMDKALGLSEKAALDYARWFAISQDKPISDVWNPNPHYRPFSEIIEEAINNYELEQPANPVFYSQSPERLTYTDLLQIIPQNIPTIAATIVDDINTRHFSTVDYINLGHVLANSNSEIACLIYQARYNRHFSKECTYDDTGFYFRDGPQEIENGKIKAFISLIDQVSLQNSPVSHSFVLEYFLHLNSGNLSQSLIDSSKFETELARGSLLQKYAPNNDYLTQSLILDEYSPVLPYQKLPTNEINVNNTDSVYYDYSLPGRLGGAYHASSMIMLLQAFPPEFISLMTLSVYLGEGDFHGALKFSSDLRIIQDLDSINTLLNSYNPDYDPLEHCDN